MIKAKTHGNRRYQWEKYLTGSEHQIDCTKVDFEKFSQAARRFAGRTGRTVSIRRAGRFSNLAFVTFHQKDKGNENN